MKKILSFLISVISVTFSYSQFAPRAGQAGSTAIHRDSSIFKAWASNCSVQRGYRNISTHDSGFATVGNESMATGKAGNGVISLGDGGIAVLTFDAPVKNGAGWDFAVFENSFSDTFLELALVEVSSDGVNYFRFPAASFTQDTVQLGTFGFIEPSRINNLAGKYRALYGTPFDLQELAGENGLDVNHITHIKIIDVVGTLNDSFASHDSSGRKINDPWPTPFESCGFDLDAVGVMYGGINTIAGITIKNVIVFPNPVTSKSIIQYELTEDAEIGLQLTDLQGKMVISETNVKREKGLHHISLDSSSLSNGIYFLHLLNEKGSITVKVLVTNE